MWKNIEPTRLGACALISLSILFTYGISVMGQKRPIALRKGVTLSPTNPQAYADAAEAYKSDRSTANRDRLIFMAVAEIDVNFSYYQKNRRYKNNLFQTVLDILEVGAATAISIVNGERPKSIIADALGFVQGSRSKVNKNLRLLEQQVLFNKMIEKRSEVLARVLDNTRQYNNTAYPFERAFLDVVAYYQAGTMDHALSALSTDTGASAQNAETQLANAKTRAGITITPSANQIRTARENSEFVQAILDTHEKATDDAAAATVRIADAQSRIDFQNAQRTPDQTLILQAEVDKRNAEKLKTDAEAIEKKELIRLKAIFTSLDADPELSLLLNSLPQRYPGIATRIQARIARIRNGTGDVEDYGFTILQVMRAVVAVMVENPDVLVRTKNVLDSVK